MKYALVGMNEWLYPDRVPENCLQEPVALSTVRGGSTGFQIRLSELAKTDVLFASFSCTAPIFGEIYYELPVAVPQNTGVERFTVKDWAIAKDYATREAPFEVYDALLPFPEAGITVSENAAVYLAVKAPEDLLPGDYSALFALTDSTDTVGIALTFHVAAGTLPNESLTITNWFSLKNMASAHATEMWSPKHWQMIERYGRAMRRMHQNAFWLLDDTVDVTQDADGYHFDFARRERLIRLYLGMGFTVIEGGPVFHRREWNAVTFLVRTPKGNVPAMSNEGYEYAIAYLQAWYAFLQAHGWLAQTVQHIGDEPHERCADEYRILSGIVRKYMPGVRLIDAIETHELQGAVDIWVPKNRYYEMHTADVERLRALGDEIWFYTCCEPGGFYCNRLLDMPLLRARMLHWGNFRYAMPGFLHWGLNHWMGDPFKDTCPANGPTDDLPAGDSHVVYPHGEAVLSSMRGEMMKCGAEDYELLRALAQKHPAEADALCNTVFRKFDDCDNEPAVFDAVHDRLIAAFDAE